MSIQIQNLKKLSATELPEGYRVARIIAKGGKIGARETESLGAAVRTISSNTLQLLLATEQGAEYFRQAVEAVQDSILRKRAEAGAFEIFETELDYDAIIAAITVSVESSRFGKDAVTNWFNADMKPVIVARLEEKMPGIAADRAEKLALGYLNSFLILAGRNPSMSNEVKAQLVRAMELLPEGYDSAVCNTIAEKLAAVTEASTVLEAL